MSKERHSVEIRSTPPPPSVYEAVGGRPYFERLIDVFYSGVESDELLRPMYPDDLTESRRNMVDFLGQYWGGPTAYSDRKGHPRLRMRHAPFPVDEAARTAWLSHMNDAIEATDGASDEIKATMNDYFAMAANHLLNS